jgi:hypothetical protein
VLLAKGVEMRKWLLLFCVAVCLTGCASDGYQPGIRGVRDLPQANYHIPSYGMVNNGSSPNNSWTP